MLQEREALSAIAGDALAIAIPRDGFAFDQRLAQPILATGLEVDGHWHLPTQGLVQWLASAHRIDRSESGS